MGDGPRLIGGTEVSVIGKLLMWSGDSPVILDFCGSDLQYIPLFDELADLKEFAQHLNIEWDGILQVDDANFLDAFRGTNIRAITNIRNVDGRMRYSQYRVEARQIH